MQKITSIHTKFLLYLEKNVRRLSPEQQNSLVDFAETKLPGFIRTYFNPAFGELYDTTDPLVFREIRHKVSTHAAAKAANEAEDTLYTVTLKYYAEFLQSKIFKGKEKVKLTAQELAEAKVARSPQKKAPQPVSDPLLPDDEQTPGLTEGRMRQVNLTKHERNPFLRQLCLKHYGYTCQVCGMNFGQMYGALGKDFIEVHHINPLSETDGEHVLDPTVGLIPLCSNCHSMIHRSQTGHVLTPRELKEIINQNQHHE